MAVLWAVNFVLILDTMRAQNLTIEHLQTAVGILRQTNQTLKESNDLLIRTTRSLITDCGQTL